MAPPERPSVRREDWTGALLVGGGSRRMGRDKLRLRLPGGEALAAVAARALMEVCGSLLAVGGGAEGLLPAAFERQPDAVEGIGPAGGLLAALRRARTPWVLVLSADLPAVDAAFLAELQERAAADPGRVLFPWREGRSRHQASAWPRVLLPRVEAAVADGRRALRELAPLESLRFWNYGEGRVPGRIRDPLANLNSPRDWRSWTGQGLPDPSTPT